MADRRGPPRNGRAGDRRRAASRRTPPRRPHARPMRRAPRAAGFRRRPAAENLLAALQPREVIRALDPAAADAARLGGSSSSRDPRLAHLVVIDWVLAPRQAEAARLADDGALAH